MKPKIHHPVPSKKDATGLTLVGRHDDGRYQYEIETTVGDLSIASMTHPERVGLAIVRASLLQAFGPHYYIYPLLRSSNWQGYGLKGRKTMWLERTILHHIGRSFLRGEPLRKGWDDGDWSTVIHEAGHNHQPYMSKPHGPEWRKAEAWCRCELWKVLYRGWPKLDMRKLRDSVAPHLRRKAKVGG